MTYFKGRHARIILTAFVLSSVALWDFPEIDLIVSRLFFDEGFYLAQARWTQVLHEAVGPLIAVSMIVVGLLYAFNRINGRKVGAVDGKKVAYLFLVLALGAGLIVNATLKDNFGRVRPRDIQEFGGARQFTPAFVITDGCKTNCSFSSGDSAGAFFSLALVMAFSRRRALVAAAVGFGVLVSFSRIAIGAHFLSDTIVSFFVMLISAHLLYHYVIVAQRVSVRELRPAPGVVIRPATVLSTAAEP